jgi:hypothetical protein
MTVITIPKKITKGEELVVLPRQEYEKLVEGKIQEFKPTITQKKALAAARKNRERGKILTLSELKNKLGITA